MPGGKPTATEKRLKERQAKLSAAGEERSAAISEEDALEAVSDLEGKVETWHLAAEKDCQKSARSVTRTKLSSSSSWGRWRRR